MLSIALAALLAAGTAHAQFKCTTPTGVSLQQLPCAADARSERLVVPVMTSERPERIRAALARGRVAIGMTRAEVERVFGAPPDKVNTSVYPHAVEQQLIFRDRVTEYVYLRNGIVTSFSGSD